MLPQALQKKLRDLIDIGLARQNAACGVHMAHHPAVSAVQVLVSLNKQRFMLLAYSPSAPGPVKVGLGERRLVLVDLLNFGRIRGGHFVWSYANH